VICESATSRDDANTDERMTRKTKAKASGTKLPCLWAEENGFEVVPKPAPAKERQGVGPDTALLLKSKASPRPNQSAS
jgi:hypothetical protein